MFFLIKIFAITFNVTNNVPYILVNVPLYTSPSYLQNSEYPIYDFAQEHVIILHFETKNKVSDDIKLWVEVLVFAKGFWHWRICLTLEVLFHFNFYLSLLI